jgi:hypothetical protein
MSTRKIAENEVGLNRVFEGVRTVLRFLGFANSAKRPTNWPSSIGKIHPAFNQRDAQWVVDNWDALVSERVVVRPMTPINTDSVIGEPSGSPKDEILTD